MKKAIIIGTSSGIGEALCRIYSAQGYELGMAARRTELMENIRNEMPGTVHIRMLDVTKTNMAMTVLKELLEKMEDVDTIILNSGAGHQNPEMEWEREKVSLDVNIVGFTALANVAFHYFKKRGQGHLVGISSVAGLRGNRFAPAYSASKAYLSQYLEGLRHKSVKENLNITITDIRPGFVDTAMAQGDRVFWSAPPSIAARQIFRAIQQNKKTAYITRRWKMIAAVIRILPDFIYNRI